MKFLSPRQACVVVLISLFTSSPSPLLAQNPPPVNPQAPLLNAVTPSGMQRGTSLELTFTGANLAGPTGVWTSCPARVTIPTADTNGKDNARLRVHLDVPADAPPGFHGIRLATRQGMSNLLLFCVDDLPQVLEAGKNHSPATAQAVPVPCVVAGKAEAEALSYFKVSVTANQRLSFEVIGRRLGTAFDPQLQLLDVAGRELPGGYSNDAPGLLTDARLSYTFRTAGDYLVAIRDVSYRGGAMPFRLRIGDFPCATAPVPMAARRGSKATLTFAGPQVEGAAPQVVDIPSDPALQVMTVVPRGANGQLGWPVLLGLSDRQEILEKEPNDDAAHAQHLPFPASLTGRFERKGDQDHFVVPLKKGTRSIIRARTIELGSPTEVYMVLRDGKGNSLQASDPQKEAMIDFTAPSDGDYTLVVEHLHYWGGPDETYHLNIAPQEPSFDLTLALDRFNTVQGGTLSVPIVLTRHDHAGPIELNVVGPRGVSGHLVVPGLPKPGPKTPPPAGPVMMNIQVDEVLPPGPVVFQIQGKATIDGKDVVRLVSVQQPIRQGLANLPLIPPPLADIVAVAVTEKPPLTLTAHLDAASYKVGKTATLTVTASRRRDVTGPIALTITGLPAGVTADMKPLPEGQVNGKVTLSLAKAPPGRHSLGIMGKTRLGSQEIQVTSPAIALVIDK